MSKLEAIATVILFAFILAVALVSQADAKVQGVPIKGGTYKTMTVAQWQLHKYKYTTLLQRSPLSWCPYKSYVLVDQYVTVENRKNLNWLCINADLVKLTKADASYNKAHAKKYKGKTRDKVKKIYKYCYHTKYKLHFFFCIQIKKTNQ